ncbi:MAG: tRNA (adenosine(37)-N6)-threonylcarbamoyltransferase complex ATPase subunit type 1 TsaE [Candidatus Komeilibacteria bacterium]|nr:tRNA (adenosine(37)-N6)-threonylcarbamoyltransferase complex ATPase subunit type 1 TsaE [Candidatus Komeilibacteria bacterium]
MRISKNLTETGQIATEVAVNLKGGEVIGLVGELGAGKTTFVQALADSLGIKEKVASPTFVLMKVYSVIGHQSISKLVHVDAYRLRDAEELKNIGLLDYLGQPDTVTVIEWANQVKDILPPDSRMITISPGEGENDRTIDF